MTNKKLAKKEEQEEITEDSEEHKQKEKRSIFASIIIIAGICVVVIGILFSGKIIDTFRGIDDRLTYNGFEFVKGKCPYTKDTLCWFGKVYINNQAYVIPFRNSPLDVEHIVLDDNVRERLIYHNKSGTAKVLVEKDLPAQYVLAATDISRMLGDRYGVLNINTSGGIYDDPFTCEDATQDNLVVYFKPSSIDYIQLQGDCVVLNVIDGEHAMQVADRLSYDLLGIIQ